MAKGFDYEALTYDDRLAIHDALAETTAKHITGNEELFSSRPFDPVANPSQILETVHLPAGICQEQDVELLGQFAAPAMTECFREELKKQPGFIGALRYIVNNERRNVAFVSPHGKIIDIAVWAGCLLLEMGFDEMQERNGLIISKGVPTLEVAGIAASEEVQKIGHVFLSFPRTSTIDALDIDSGLMEDSNRRMRSELVKWLGSKVKQILPHPEGNIINFAWSGKTDKVRRDENGQAASVELGSVNERGTIDITSRCVVAPVSFWDEDEPKVEIGELTDVKTRADIVRVQQWHKASIARMSGIPLSAITIESS